MLSLEIAFMPKAAKLTENAHCQHYTVPCTWLEKMKLNWQEVHVIVRMGMTLPNILKIHANVFTNELQSMKDITVKLCIKPKCQTTKPV